MQTIRCPVAKLVAKEEEDSGKKTAEKKKKKKKKAAKVREVGVSQLVTVLYLFHILSFFHIS